MGVYLVCSSCEKRFLIPATDFPRCPRCKSTELVRERERGAVETPPPVVLQKGPLAKKYRVVRGVRIEVTGE